MATTFIMLTDAIKESFKISSSSLNKIYFSLKTLNNLRNLKKRASFISFNSYGVLMRFSLSC